jgi:hypothetical protein
MNAQYKFQPGKSVVLSGKRYAVIVKITIEISSIYVPNAGVQIIEKKIYNVAVIDITGAYYLPKFSDFEDVSEDDILYEI